MNTVTRQELVALLNEAGEKLSTAYDCSKTNDCWEEAHRNAGSTIREDASDALRDLAVSMSENMGPMINFFVTHVLPSSEKDVLDIRDEIRGDINTLFKLSAQLRSVTNVYPWKVRFIPGFGVISYYLSLANVQ
jgi:hypothetical protein